MAKLWIGAKMYVVDDEVRNEFDRLDELAKENKRLEATIKAKDLIIKELNARLDAIGGQC